MLHSVQFDQVHPKKMVLQKSTTNFCENLSFNQKNSEGIITNEQNNEIAKPKKNLSKYSLYKFSIWMGFSPTNLLFLLTG